MKKEIYVELKGGRKVIIGGRVIKWKDCHGDHEGKVVSYGKTVDRGGSPVTHEKDVYFVDCGPSGVREVRRHEMRDIIERL